MTADRDIVSEHLREGDIVGIARDVLDGRMGTAHGECDRALALLAQGVLSLSRADAKHQRRSPSAANTLDCLRELRGRTIIGVVMSKESSGAPGFGSAKILVLDDGTGFAFNSLGSFWRVSEREMERELAHLRRDYEQNGALLADVLEAAGTRP